MEASGPNAEQISYWNEVTGKKWVALADLINDQIEPIGNEAMDRSGVQSGDRVLDVGCGCGQTSLALAGRVGPSGSVTGVDISDPMLSSARERATAGGVTNVEFLQADAQTHAFAGGSIDAVFSRFGVMFFDDPPAAFANIRSALRPGGRLTFACWQGLGQNEWMRVPIGAVLQHVELPMPADPQAPGPFAFAEAGRVRDILGKAGFTDVNVDSLESKLRVAAGLDLEQTIDFLMQMGPAGAALREASDELREAARSSMREAVAPYQHSGALEMSSAAWIVTAGSPG